MYPDPNYQDPNSGNPFEVDVNSTWKLTAVEHVPCPLFTQEASSRIHGTPGQPCPLTQSEPICTHSFCDCFDLKKPAVIVRLPPPCVSMQDYANSDDDADADDDDE